jgi:hypothetical protein
MALAICNKCLNFNPRHCEYVRDKCQSDIPNNAEQPCFDTFHGCTDFQLDLRLLPKHKTFVES